jgi:acetolactate synthase I/II/III large subunit
MNGGELLVKTAVHAGIEVCFANPGTTELPIVAAMDSVPGIRPILCLFEGVCTGAADGYGRMAGKPAMTLLHLGPGMGNGIANLHNARRGHSPILNVIGEHASWHRPSDPPLTMDIEALARTVSGWLRTCRSAADISKDTAEAVAAALRGQVATLVVPHDYQWADLPDELPVSGKIARSNVDATTVEETARLLESGIPALLLLGGSALNERGLVAAARIEKATGCRLMSETLPARMERGPGLPALPRLPYFPEQAHAALEPFEAVVTAGAADPVSFFGYKGAKSSPLRDDQQLKGLSPDFGGADLALECLADVVAPHVDVRHDLDPHPKYEPRNMPKGPLTAEKAAQVLAALQPANAVIVDESVTSGGHYYALAASAPRHSLLTLTGGAIGQGMPCAVGASVACPDRPVINFQADGSALYTFQALWTQAREALNITTLLCSNSAYEILRIELARAGEASSGEACHGLTDLGNPHIDWVNISKGLGVPAVSTNTAEGLAHELNNALSEPGPHFIELVL